MIKFVRLLVFALAVSVLLGAGFVNQASALSFQRNRIIDDVIFDNVNSMSAAGIDAFLNTFPNSCISPNSGFRSIQPIGYNPSAGYQFGGAVTAGQVIYDAGQAYGLNPQVLLVTLEKEQSLVSGRNDFAGYCNNGDEHKYTAAVGYGCPDSGTSYSYTNVFLYQRNGSNRTSTGTTCVNSAAKAGFSQQVIRAAWLLKFGQQRSRGNIGWAVIRGSWNNSDDPQTCYGGPMAQGTWQRCPSGSTAYYDGITTIDGVAVHMDTGASAALYWYTPHFHGNENFYALYTSWFGSTISNYCVESSQKSIITDVAFRKLKPNIDSGEFTIYSGSQTSCVESHGWSENLTSWQDHTVSNLPSIDPANGTIAFADLTGTGLDNPILIKPSNTGSGMAEFHVWDYSMHNWIVHAISNLPQNTPNIAIDFASLTGNKVDTPVAIGYASTSSGMVELHLWNNGLQSWRQHIVTNLPEINPSNMLIRFAAPDKKGDDVGIAVGTNNTSTGMVEFHVWNPGFYSWDRHVVSNLSTANAANGYVMFADLNGDGRDEAVFVQTKNTSSGRIEFHIWNSGFTGWENHVVSNQALL